jgi:hypothetical protein
MFRWVLFCNVVRLICEVGIIAATLIFLRNELAWQKLLEDSGRQGHGKAQLTMLILSIVTTASVMLLTILGSGNITRGMKIAVRGARKFSRVASSILPSTIRKDKTFMTVQDSAGE